MTFFGLDLGGSHATCSLIRGEAVLATEHLDFPDSTRFAPVAPQIEATFRKFAEASPEPPQGLGIGFAGLADSRRNRVLSTNGKYEDALNLDFDAWGREKLGVPVRIENDARLALRGEMLAGAARGIGNVVMFTLGTGIGGVVAMDGAPLVGAHGEAGVLAGHVPVRAHGRRCTCGGQGCAEAEASGWALPGIAREWPGFETSVLSQQPLNFKSLFASAAEGDRVALEIKEHCLTIWSMMTVAAVHSFDPEIVIFGGGAMGAGDEILPVIQKYVNENTWTAWGKPRMVAAQLGSQAAALGVPSLFAKDKTYV